MTRWNGHPRPRSDALPRTARRSTRRSGTLRSTSGPPRAETPQAPYAHGLALYRAGKYRQAAVELEPLSRAGGFSGDVARYYLGMCRRELGLAALRRGEHAAAERFFRRALADAGRDADLCSYLARLCAVSARPEACEREAARAVDAAGGDVSAWRRLAQAQWRNGRREEAYMSLQQAARIAGDHPELNLQRGLFLAAEGRFTEALPVLARAARRRPADPDAHHYLGLCAAAEGDTRAACRALQRAFDLNPTDLAVARHLALAAGAARTEGLRVTLRLPESVGGASTRSDGPGGGLDRSRLRDLADYVVREPDFVDGLLALSPSPADGEVFSLLLRVLDAATASRPEYADLHLRCGRVLRRLDRDRAAETRIRRALEINPRYVEARIELGRLLAETGRGQEAAHHLHRAVTDGADYPDIHLLLGRLAADASRREDARRHLRRALDLKQDYPAAAQLLDRLAA